MLADLLPEQRALADCMSEISEHAWNAAWMDDLEGELWRALRNGPRLYGRLEISEERLAQLRKLSDQCGGWIYFDPVAEETFLPLELWERRCRTWMFEAYLGAAPNPEREERFLKIVQDCGGRLDCREAPDTDGTSYICLTYEFDSEEDAERAFALVRSLGEAHLEGPVLYSW